MSSSRIIDGGVFIGWDTKSTVAMTDADLLQMLQDNGIDSALTASFQALYGYPDEGHAHVLRLSREYPDRIVPLAIGYPLAFLPGQGQMQALARQGFKVIGFFPMYQSWPLASFAFAQMAREAAEAGLAIQVAVSDWQELITAARTLGPMGARGLIRWVRGGGYLYGSEEVAMAREFPKLCFDVGNMTMTGGIQRLCEQIGAHRLFMSSNAPLTYERSIYYRVRCEDLLPQDREQICGRTIERVVQGDA